MKENLSRPVVSAIIERIKDGKKQILVMTRWKPDRDPIYSGTLEIPAGHINAFENVYDTVKREVFEETGLTVIKFIPDVKTKIHSPKDDGAFAFSAFCCQQQIKNGLPWVGFVFLCEVDDTVPIPQEGETKDIKWMDCEVFRSIFMNNPEKIFTLQLGVFDYYFNCYKS